MSDFLEDSKVFVNKVMKYESIDSSLQQCTFFTLICYRFLTESSQLPVYDHAEC